MKPEKLKFYGVKSYCDETVVEFDKLLKSGLFGIFGNTGSGKSTILDCIFLALYGRLPKTGEREDYINVKTGKCYVEFSFSLTDKGIRKKYEVYREFQLKGNRKVAPAPIAKLYEYKGDGKFPLEDNTYKVNQKLLDIVGLEIDDFEKCIVLPQGEFSAFVTLQRSSRLSMISGLFNLDKYGDKLTERLKIKLVDLDKEIQFLKGRLTSYEDANKDNLNSLSKSLEETKSAYDVEVVNLSKIEEEFNDYKRNYERRNEYLTCKKELLKLEEVKDNIKNYEVVLSKFSDAKNYIEALDEKAAALKDLNDLDRLGSTLFEKQTTFLEELEDIDSKLLNETDKTKEILTITEEIAKLNLLKEEKRANDALQKELLSLRNLYSETLKTIQSRTDDLEKLKDRLNRLNVEEKYLNLEEKISNKIDELVKDSQSAFLNDEINFLRSLKDFTTDFDVVLKRIDFLKSLTSETASVEQSVKALNALYQDLDEYGKKSRAINAEIADLQVKIKDYDNTLKSLTEKGYGIKETIAKTEEKINAITGGESLDSKISALNQKKSTIENYFDNLKKQKDEVNDRILKVKFDILANQAKIDEKNSLVSKLNGKTSALSSAFQTDDEAKKIYSYADKIDDLRKARDEYSANYLSLNNKLKSLASYANLEEYTDEGLLLIGQKLEKTRKNRDDLYINYNNLSNQYENLSQKFEKRCKIDKELLAYEHEMKIAQTLHEAVKNKKLLAFVAEEYLAEIALDAKSILMELTNGRFGLVYSVDFYVEDFFYGGGSLRRVDAVSGGELFLVSLSLALALSKCIYAKSYRPMEFFFLDEGFGSLDKELLEVVLDCLYKLKNSNFSIGVISHVEGLKERLPARISVVGASGNKGSTITITA